MHKISKKYAGLLSGALFGIITGIFMSFFLTWLNIGFVANFIQKWMIAYFATLPAGFIISLLVGPIVKAIVDRLIEV
jgi:fructose-specific phosphotransferase system IIC component